MNIWPSIAKAGRRELVLVYGPSSIFCFRISVDLFLTVSNRVISIDMRRSATDRPYGQITESTLLWTYSVENEHLACKELEI